MQSLSRKRPEASLTVCCEYISPARGGAHGRAMENISDMYIPLAMDYFHISLPNSAKAFTRSFRLGHFAMDSLENRPSAGFLVARHS